MTINYKTHFVATPKPHGNPTPEGSGGNKHTKGDFYKFDIKYNHFTKKSKGKNTFKLFIH